MADLNNLEKIYFEDKEVELKLILSQTIKINKHDSLDILKKLAKTAFSRYSLDYDFFINDIDISKIDDLNALKTLEKYNENTVVMYPKHSKHSKHSNVTNHIKYYTKNNNNTQTLQDYSNISNNTSPLRASYNKSLKEFYNTNEININNINNETDGLKEKIKLTCQNLDNLKNKISQIKHIELSNALSSKYLFLIIYR